MSNAGEQTVSKNKSVPKGSDTGRQAESQIRNLDNTVKRLHKQRSDINKQMAEDEKELAWVNSEIKAWEEKRRRVMQIKQDHADQASNIARVTADCRKKLDEELLATARGLVAATKKTRRDLEKKEYIPKHKVTLK
jgi:hypothetical protein